MNMYSLDVLAHVKMIKESQCHYRNREIILQSARTNFCNEFHANNCILRLRWIKNLSDFIQYKMNWELEVGIQQSARNTSSLTFYLKAFRAREVIHHPSQMQKLRKVLLGGSSPPVLRTWKVDVGAFT